MNKKKQLKNNKQKLNKNFKYIEKTIPVDWNCQVC